MNRNKTKDYDHILSLDLSDCRPTMKSATWYCRSIVAPSFGVINFMSGRLKALAAAVMKASFILIPGTWSPLSEVFTTYWANQTAGTPFAPSMRAWVYVVFFVGVAFPSGAMNPPITGCEM